MSVHARACAARLIVALDCTQLAPALALARRLRGVVRTLKVGSMLFTACGPSAIQRIRALGFEVMLDLKFHDIPSTVEGCCQAAAAQRVRMLTVHAAGGRAMLEAAVRGVHDQTRRRKRRPLVLAVTVLTSVPQQRGADLRGQAVALAREALRAGCDGVVTSAQEVPAIRRACGRQLMIVAPGIRPPGTSAGDQSRICTPREALERGADCLVVGRPITAARDPRDAARAILEHMEHAAAC